MKRIRNRENWSIALFLFTHHREMFKKMFNKKREIMWYERTLTINKS